MAIKNLLARRLTWKLIGVYTVGHADGFAVDCVGTCEHCMLLIVLNLVVCEEKQGVFERKKKL